MKVKACMTPDVRCIRQNDSLQEAAKAMWEQDCGALPVLNSKKQVVGMITDRDIALAGFKLGRSLKDIAVKESMSKSLVSVGLETDLDAAEKLMQSQQLCRLPVVDNERQLKGILSLNDIANAYKRDGGKQVKANEVADTLASIGIHRSLANTAAQQPK